MRNRFRYPEFNFCSCLCRPFIFLIAIGLLAVGTPAQAEEKLEYFAFKMVMYDSLCEPKLPSDWKEKFEKVYQSIDGRERVRMLAEWKTVMAGAPDEYFCAAIRPAVEQAKKNKGMQ